MSVIKVAGGIGKGKIYATPSGDAPPRTFILPLTQQGGYNVLWSDESFTQRLISLDISNRQIEERQVVIDGFGNFFFDWSNLPMPYSFVQDAIAMWNIRGTYDFLLTPKYENYIGLPDLNYEVNLIGQEGLNFVTGDSVLSPGTFGIKLYFRTKKNQKITTGQATGVLQGGGSYNSPFEGEGLS